MLKFSDVRYHYQTTSFHFDWEMKAGEVVAILGPSGAGKSTLLNLVAGFIQPVSGEIEIEGNPVIGLEPHQRPLAMLFQEHNLFAHLTVAQNIGLGIHPGLKLTPQQHQQVQDAAKNVGVDEFLNRLPEQLSGGQKQRVALARCFVQQCSLWLLDEPFSALDPILREEMLTLVKLLAQQHGITVLMVTHNIVDAKSIASHYAFVDDGMIASHGDITLLNQRHEHAGLDRFIVAANSASL